MYLPPPLIDHRSMEYHYTKEVSHIAKCTYTQGTCTPLQLTIDLWNATTPNRFNIYQMYIYQGPPPPIDHRCMEYHYTK